jgi:spoIIIJ-associated protein
MPKSIEAQGVTVDEAIQTALNLLGLGRDSVEIEIIHHPRSGFLGIGARRAKVRATMREQVMRDGEEFDMAPDGGSRGRRRRRSSRRRTPRGAGEQKPRDSRASAPDSPARRPASEARSPEATPQAGRTGGGAEAGAGAPERSAGEQRGRSRGRRGGRGRGGSDKRRPGEQGPASPTGESAQADTGAAEAPGNERPATGRSRSGEQPAGKRFDPEQLRSRAQQLTSALIEHMGVDATVSVQVEGDGSVAVTIDAADGGAVLIGRRGTTLDALEHIINRMTTGADPGARVRVTLDVCGYRERRKATLGDAAIRLKDHAISSMRRVQITPLSPNDRVLFQEALAGDDSVTTRIVGSGFYRRVLVIPRGQESDGRVVEEFNEEGQIVGYPTPGAVEEDPADEASREPLGVSATSVPLDTEESRELESETGGEPRREES